MKKKIIICLLSVLVVLGLGFITYLAFFTPSIIFIQQPLSIEIHEEVTPMAYIKAVRNGTLDDVSVVEQNVDQDVLGEYTILYQMKNKTIRLHVHVVDTIPPSVETKEVTINIGDDFLIEDAIAYIEDATKTTIRLKNEEHFDQVKTKNVILVIRDEGGNETEVSALIHVLEKDTTPPSITASNITLHVGDHFDPLSYASAYDAQDGNVAVEIIVNDVDITTPGSYSITYLAKDKHENRAEKTIEVQVEALPPVGDKVIYLTIDDGPSANTPAILDILDQYQVKATFFVTAQSPSYLGYIKDAYHRGHTIGLHTYSHNYASVYASDTAYFQDLQAISDVVYQQIGIHPDIIRFPGGSSNTISANYSSGIMRRLTKAVRSKGYQYFDWNASSGDGNSSMSSSALIQNGTSYGNYDAIMLLTHDHAGSQASVEALPSIISYYLQHGYTFKTIDKQTNGYHHGINN